MLRTFAGIESKCRRKESICMHLRNLLVCVAACMLFQATAGAVVFPVNCITNNNATDCATAEAQLSINIQSLAAGFIHVTFNNTGPNASSIADVYFDDIGDFIGPASASNPLVYAQSAGVDFGIGASPGNLPGGNAISFSADYSSDSNSPTQPNGVNPGEFLTIQLALNSGASLSDVLGGLGSTFNVGMHVQGFAGGGSESVMAVVPEPAHYALGLTAGLCLLFWRARRRGQLSS